MPEIIDRRISFNNGEISPWLDPRIDLDKYRSSCRSLRNMLPTPFGGAFRRPGSIPIGYTLSNNRALLRPFVSGNGTTWMLEFTDQKLRIWTTGNSPAIVQSGGVDIEIDTPFAAADLREIHFAQVNDLLFLCHRLYAPRVLARYSDTKWRLRTFNPEWPALLEVNTTKISLTPSSSSPTPAAWSDATTYAAGDIATRSSVSYASRLNGNLDIEPAVDPEWEKWWRVLGSTTYGPGKLITLTASDALFDSSMTGQKWALEYDQAALSATLDLTASSVPTNSSTLYVLGSWSAALTATTTGSAGFTTTVLVQRSEDLDTWETIAELAGNFSDVQQLISGSEEKPCFIRLRLSAKSGTLPTDYTARINTNTARQTGLVRLTEYLTTTTFRAIVEFPLPAAGGATSRWYEDAFGGTNGWPQAMTVHEGRLWFAGTKTRPTTLWASRVDRVEDFRLSTEEDAAQSYLIASDRTSRIRWIVSADDLLIGTEFDTWTLARRNAADNLRARRQATIGSHRCPALLSGDSVLFIQENQRSLRECAWNAERARYTSQDLNLLSEHLGESRFVEFHVATNPHTTIWIVREDGTLVSCLYEREQNITGWASHDMTGGTIKSVCCIPNTDGFDDEVWLCVERTVNSVTKHFIERLNPRGIHSLKNATQMEDWLVYVDCAIQGTIATGSITGPALAELEGKTVYVIHNGINLGTYTITSGAITGISDLTLAGVCTLGIGYTSALQPSFMEFDDPKVSSKSGKKRLTRAVLEFYKTRRAEITGNETRSFVFVKDELEDTTRTLFSGLIEEHILADTERQTTPRLRQERPFPMNVLSITSRFEFEND